MAVPNRFQRDENFVPITNLGFQASKTITYAAGTTGAVGATTLFTVTGTVSCNVFAICDTDLTGTGTIEVGVSGSTAALCSQQTATAIDAHEVWHNGNLSIAQNVATNQHIVDQNVIQTIGTNTVTGGKLRFYCVWTPLTDGATVTAT